MDSLKTWENQVAKEQQAKVAATLEKVLSSAAFRNSRQCQRFLRYVVEHSYADAGERLKERTIGAELFDRPPDYDTSEDPIVRVRATEVRKRLAQYHGEEGTDDAVRFEIPSGSYRVSFHWRQSAVTPPPSRPRWYWIAAAVITLLGVIAVAIALWPVPPAPIDAFWAPALRSPRPVLIYCGQPVVYFLSRNIHERYRETLPPEKQRGSYTIALDPDATVRGSDIIPVTEQFVGIGNAHTASLLSALFARKQKTVEIRYANDISFSDLRTSPAVLIGAFSNLWTLEMTGQLRLVFEQEKGIRRIRDRVQHRTWQLDRLASDGKTPEDYAVVSRLFDSAAGQFLISAAGITQYGTRAAGEFLVDSSRIREAVAGTQQDWQRRNLQVLLHTTIYKGTPASPRIVAVHVW